MRRTINYPLGKTPKELELINVTKNVFWMRIPLPFSLNHINIWLIEEVDSWTVIDSGVNCESNQDYWQQVISTKLKNKPIKQIICTHMHPDHIGLSSWLCEKQGAQLRMSQGEFDGYQNIISTTQKSNYSFEYQFYHSNGANSEQVKLYDNYIGMYRKYVYPISSKNHALVAGELLTLGEYEWCVVIGSGHSPEHVCLWCEELNLFISGDQILPTISSNISVHPPEPDANPLKNWLNSCKYLKTLLNNDVLVLPAHGKPFTEVEKRLEEQTVEIESDLMKLVDYCSEPKKVTDGFNVLFRSSITHNNFMMACGESRAHFNYLIHKKRLNTYTDDENVSWYFSC
ncbi:MAG: MBL fold metallo-hydrolase [Methylococcales bacterium]